MKTVFKSALVAMILAAGASAQQGGFGVGVALVGQFPAGDFENTAGFGYGGMGGIEMGGDNIHLTARSGYLKHLEESDREIRFVPLFAGLKASTIDGGVYIAGELGPVFTHSEYVGPVLLGEDRNENNLGWGLGLGSNSGPFDIRFMFNVWDSRHVDRSMTVGISIGFMGRSY